MNHTFETYLLMVGILSSKYSYCEDDLLYNIDFFKKCFDDKISPNESLLSLSNYLITNNNSKQYE